VVRVIRPPLEFVTKQSSNAARHSRTRGTVERNQPVKMSMDFASYMGPGDVNLPRSEVSGYQPVSRIGEVAMNAFGTLLPFLTHVHT